MALYKYVYYYIIIIMVMVVVVVVVVVVMMVVMYVCICLCQIPEDPSSDSAGAQRLIQNLLANSAQHLPSSRQARPHSGNSAHLVLASDLSSLG